MNKILTTTIALLFAVGVSTTANAYVGPVAGMSILGAASGLVLALLATLGFLLSWPIKRMLSKKKAAEENSDANNAPEIEPAE